MKRIALLVLLVIVAILPYAGIFYYADQICNH
jgi:hypothetical protein